MGIGERLPVPEGTEVAVVFTQQIKAWDDGYVEVTKVYNTAFDGEGAGRRAHAFRESEEKRGDFPADDGWSWHVWMNGAARGAYGNWLTEQMLGPD